MDWLQDPYQDAVLRGAAAAAREHDISLVAFPGGMLGAPGRNGACRNHLFDLVRPEDFQGVIVMSGTLGNFGGPDGLSRLCDRYARVPVCSIGVEVPGTGFVSVDNGAGMRSAIEHLIRVHECHRIAFIRGPEVNAEAEQRFRAYVEVLRENSLPVDEDLIVPGDFQRDGGVRAVRVLLDERSIPLERIDAIAGAADLMVMGARDELESRNIQIPEDIALIGFDDIEESRWVAPPLASIRQPLEQQGRAAVGMVLRQLTSGKSEERVTLTTQLLPRASCGCLLHGERVLARRPEPESRFGMDALLIQRKEAILAAVTRASQGMFGSAGRGWEDHLVNSFASDLRDDSEEFLPTLQHQMDRVVGAGGDVTVAHGVLSALRAELLAIASDATTLRRMTRILDDARLLIGTAAERVQAQLRLDAKRWIRALGQVSGRLSEAQDIEAIGRVACEEFPKLGLRSFFLVRYLGDSAEKAELVVAFGPWGTTPWDGASVFDAREIVPPRIGGRIPPRLIVEPLFHEQKRLGLAGFEIAEFGGFAYEVLRELLSAALLNSTQRRT